MTSSAPLLDTRRYTAAASSGVGVRNSIVEASKGVGVVHGGSRGTNPWEDGKSVAATAVHTPQRPQLERLSADRNNKLPDAMSGKKCQSRFGSSTVTQADNERQPPRRTNPFQFQVALSPKKSV